MSREGAGKDSLVDAANSPEYLVARVADIEFIKEAIEIAIISHMGSHHPKNCNCNAFRRIKSKRDINYPTLNIRFSIIKVAYHKADVILKENQKRESAAASTVPHSQTDCESDFSDPWSVDSDTDEKNLQWPVSTKVASASSPNKCPSSLSRHPPPPKFPPPPKLPPPITLKKPLLRFPTAPLKVDIDAIFSERERQQEIYQEAKLREAKIPKEVISSRNGFRVASEQLPHYQRRPYPNRKFKNRRL